jgi:hypothetical protein
MPQSPTNTSCIAYLVSPLTPRVAIGQLKTSRVTPLNCASIVNTKWRRLSSVVSLEAPSHQHLQFQLVMLVRKFVPPQEEPMLTIACPDFADFAEAPAPAPASFSTIPTGASSGLFAASTDASSVPYTKWYNIHERYSLSDFKNEGVILIFIFIIVIIHLYGTSTNRKKAKAWMNAHATLLRKEFALVGFGGRGTTSDEVESNGLAKSLELPEDLLKEKSPQEYATYATGRQNVAFVDVTLTLLKRYNPLIMFAEWTMSLFFDSSPAPVERMEAILYPFDGREALTVPGQAPGAHELRKDTKSSYDGFVWAIVNKDTMKGLRDDRYDVSITQTKDNSKLPNWATVMSESSEITEFLLTPELIKAVEDAGDLLEHLILTDQPIDRPLKYAYSLSCENKHPLTDI